MCTKSLGSFLRVTLTLMLALGSTTLLRPTIASAAGILTVTKVADTNDGKCDADCSLREAITLGTNGDTIVFKSSLAGQTITLSSQLDIAKNLTIDGSSLSVHIKISGNNDDFNKAVRVFSINSGAAVILTHLDIIKGYPGLHNPGGGIYNMGMLTVQNSTLSQNGSIYGGGIYNLGTLIIQSSILSGNSAVYPMVLDIFDGAGGGIYNSGTMTVTNSTLSGNEAGEAGGGIMNGSSGTLTVQNTTLTMNRSYNGRGGGIQNNNILTVQNSTFSRNSASGYIGGYGGGVENTGTMTVQNSTFSGNSSGGY